MLDFFKEVHTTYYSTQDISFMDYFLELINHDNEFYIHHSKLIEYGIMTSTQSYKVKTKLDDYGLIEGVDFTLNDIVEPVAQGGFVVSKHYHLTPYAFKICLMRSRKYKNQPVDPTVYCTYYLLLEKVYKYYTDYERLYSKKLVSMKDDKIDSLERKIDAQSEEIRKLIGYTKETKLQNEEILHEVEELNVKNEVLNDKVDELRDTVKERNHKVNIDPQDESKTDSYSLIRTEEKHYRIICGQHEYVSKLLSTVHKDDLLIQQTYNPNPKTMFVRVKEVINKPIQEQQTKLDKGEITKSDFTKFKAMFKLNNWIHTYYKTIVIKNIEDEDRLISMVKECDTFRENLEVP
jgi:uncharacterized coiled-coil DUF342 family protein